VHATRLDRAPAVAGAVEVEDGQLVGAAVHVVEGQVHVADAAVELAVVNRPLEPFPEIGGPLPSANGREMRPHPRQLLVDQRRLVVDLTRQRRLEGVSGAMHERRGSAWQHGRVARRRWLLPWCPREQDTELAAGRRRKPVQVLTPRRHRRGYRRAAHATCRTRSISHWTSAAVRFTWYRFNANSPLDATL
jgi:hypothetical protein